jgi:hypothetical protein
MHFAVSLLLWSARAVGAGPPDASAFPEWKPPGANIAAGKSYELPIQPNYKLCTDDGDATQLTDGQFARLAMWHFKPAVGWFGKIIPIIFDLGEARPIAGVGFHTEQNGGAGVGSPPMILILVSDDGQNYKIAGELVSLASKFGPPPRGDAQFWLRTDELKAHARYVQLVVPSSVFVMVDEVEIYEGPASLLEEPIAGESVAKPIEYVEANKTAYAVNARLAADAARALELATTLTMPPATRTKVADTLEKLRQEAVAAKLKSYDKDFRAVVPLNDKHAEIFAALSPALRASGFKDFVVWHRNRWQRQSPFDLPVALEPGKRMISVPKVELEVSLLQNDRRGEVINIGNFGDEAKAAFISFTGLPGGSTPSYIKVRQAEYVAMQSRAWDADALPLAEEKAGGWKINIPAGVSRQLWLDFHIDSKRNAAGTYRGKVKVKIQNGPTLTVPIKMTIGPDRLPPFQERAVTVGCWDYTDMDGCGSLISRKNGNLDAAIKHLKESGINGPWARSDWGPIDTFPRGEASWFNAQNELVRPIDFRNFDAWVKNWPHAKYYQLHALGWWTYAGAGSKGVIDPVVQARMRAIMKAWRDHIVQMKIDPKRIVMLLVDETAVEWQFQLTNYWAREIKAAAPEFKILMDPMIGKDKYDNPLLKQMLEFADIVMPGNGFSYKPGDAEMVAFYEAQRQAGKEMGLYTSARNASESEAIGYYRAQPWQLWKMSHGAANVCSDFWSYHDFRGYLPWNQLPGGCNDRSFSPVYIDSKSATDGKHWLAVFEGANDYEYLLMLKNRIAALEAEGKSTTALKTAQKILEEVPEAVHSALSKDANTPECDTQRMRIIEALTDLAPKPRRTSGPPATKPRTTTQTTE